MVRLVKTEWSHTKHSPIRFQYCCYVLSSLFSMSFGNLGPLLAGGGESLCIGGKKLGPEVGGTVSSI